MKVVLDFDPESHEDLEKVRIISNAFKNDNIVEQLYDTLIRKYYKHGYSDQKVNEILEKLGEDGEYLIEHFKKLIQELVNDE